MDTDKAIFMKILIVEDEPSLRELMQKTLAKERYVVETADTFHEASLKIADYSYDCILLDHVAGWERFEVVGDAQGTTEA